MSEFKSIAKEMAITNADVWLDNVTKSGIFNSFPVISNFISAVEIVKDINNCLYIKKLSAFVNGLKENGVDGDSFAKTREVYDKDQKRFESTLLFIIEKAEDDEKANLLGFITSYLVAEKISLSDYIFFANIINNTQLAFLKQFSQMFTDEVKIKNDSLYFVLSAQGLICFQGEKIKYNDEIIEHDTGLTDSAKRLGQILTDYFTKL